MDTYHAINGSWVQQQAEEDIIYTYSDYNIVSITGAINKLNKYE